MEPTELLSKVKSLTRRGLNQDQIAEELGFKIPFAFSSRVIKVPQAPKPVPIPKAAKRVGSATRVEQVEVKRRGRGEKFGVNVPQEPLVRAGIEPGTELKVTVRKGRIILTVQ